ncbi:hypothetical protein FQZ97_896110 [compost metagenome]
MLQSLASPCGSTIRNQTISAPKTMNSVWEMPAVEISTPTSEPSAGRNWFRKMGSTTMKAAPKKLPMMEPMPPMITMKSSWNERSIEKAAGSHEPRCTKPHRPPATPTMNELTAKALSLAYIGRMPITAAATSMSRIAIHSRPMAERTRFFASKPNTTRKARQNRYFCSGVSIGMPKTCRLETDTEPEALLLVNQPMRRKAQSQKNCAASVATARYRPFTRKLGMPKKIPTSVAKKPPESKAMISGMPSMRM